MYTPDQVADGILSFAEAELLPSMDGWQLWAASAALILARQRTDLLLAGLMSNKAVMALGLVDAQGAINVDAAVDALKQTAKAHGKLALDIPGMGKVTLGEADFEALREHIARAGA